MGDGDDRYYGEHLVVIEHKRTGLYSAEAIIERPDGTRFKRHRRGGHDIDIEWPETKEVDDES